MQASPLCLEFIRKKEAFFAHSYRCPAGVWTIGYGTIRWDLKTPVKPGQTITREEAEHQLAIEVQRVSDAVTESVHVPLNQNEFDALVSWGYNVGTGWITGKGHEQAHLITLLNKGRYDAVPGQLLLFRKTTTGKALDGLLNRRKEEAQMWLAHDHATVVASAIETKLPDALPENGTIPEAMPQAVAPAKAEKTTTTIAKSPSVKGASVGIIAGISAWLDNIFGWSKDTAQQVLDTTNDLGPVQTLVGNLTNHATQIGFGVTVAALVYVLWRRFKAAAEGRSV